MLRASKHRTRLDSQSKHGNEQPVHTTKKPRAKLVIQGHDIPGFDFQLQGDRVSFAQGKLGLLVNRA